MAATGAVDPMERIAALTSECDAVIGVAARDFGSGAEILFNADEVFPTASTFKTLLLYELYRQVDADRIDPAARIRFEDRHRVPGSGVLQDLDAESSLTVKDYATLMIVVSDNSATDIVYHLLGREAIAAALRDLGMARTHLPLDTWGILCGLFDLDPRDPAVTYAALRERLMTEQAAWECAALRETPDNDVSTPRDMLRLLEAIERGEGLTAASRAAVIDILQRQKYTNIIPELLPFGVRVANKTGWVRGVRNDCGIVYAGDVRYGVALMSKRARDDVGVRRALAAISRVVYDAFVGVEEPAQARGRP